MPKTEDVCGRIVLASLMRSMYKLIQKKLADDEQTGGNWPPCCDRVQVPGTPVQLYSGLPLW